MTFATIVEATDDDHVLDLCAKHLARLNSDLRHSYNGHLAGDPRGRFSEGWRFPAIESDRQREFNQVTFVWRREMDEPRPETVGLIGTFRALYDRIPLREIPDSLYWHVTLRVPKRTCHRYLFQVGGAYHQDRVNPQTETDGDGRVWSRFFTEETTRPLVLQPHERRILGRFVQHILPFRTDAAEEFLRSPGNPLPKDVYELDQAVGVVNFIDKVLAREERHNRIDYAICLREIERILRQRDPYSEPEKVSKDAFTKLYGEMWGQVPGWNTSVYGNPSHFLRMVRRHVFLGAFSHPKYGGNAMALGWRFLEQRFRDQAGNSVFDWRKAIEKPLGTNNEYVG
ncbi:gluconate 2-dehydrogenase subunit 3 family protein [Skermanella sp. TT6]|uniref:Gluconate 2-dehydrogenase subunit 3 family protein n=1 Tax=Skermanella cutis TaxID=2775420 RepID=A0ABX7B8K4_9PROT|nr:gluconate 2-dehydrogenase subunit 3 family protein [Skermanella sp. TT6]QQP90703.1 gluconate 2-dehydrogenase subunit 3 family protein [Skermanella sp. TT6]